MSGWEDLFNLAAGKGNDADPLPVLASSKLSLSSDSSRRSVKRKKTTCIRQEVPNSLTSQHVLADRMTIPDSTTSFPTWCLLGTGMLKNICPGWRGSGQRCKGCQKSPLFHRLAPQARKTGFHLLAFCFLRNIRCAALLTATNEIGGLLQVARSEALAISRLTWFAVSRGEAEILKEKSDIILNLTESEVSSKDQLIRMIIACDALYLRIYYLQNSGHLKSNDHLPHPTDYFGGLYLTMSIDFLERFDTVCHLVIDDEEVVGRFGLECSKVPKHPLSFLHQQRLIETHSLFHDAISKTFQIEPTTHSLSSLAYHETPAPSIIGEWRDSCRDVLCNLYSYATLSTDAIAQLKAVLVARNIHSIIELGAGTGYMAKVLADHGLVVDAFDINPPNHSMNEYHGQTDTFYPVKAGTVDCLRGRKIVNEALLLCYPPPQSEMAHDALKAYAESGGQCLIHVGEIAGLTGSASFEAMLKNNFECILRRPCLTWGTDAASLTIWVKPKTPLPVLSLLLPCCKCGEREATRRLRLARHVVYCNKKCFRKHAQTLKKHFLMGMIATDVDLLDFDSPNHFSPLSGGVTGMSRMLSDGNSQRCAAASSPRLLSNNWKKKQSRSKTENKMNKK
jgi:hypothetical protein